ncbi:MAG: hypothetical protein ACR2LV_09485 [Solirubrobacteraceae bacterium]
MFGRLSERLVTGPGAFFLAGMLDLEAFMFGALRRKLRRLTPGNRSRSEPAPPMRAGGADERALLYDHPAMAARHRLLGAAAAWLALGALGCTLPAPALASRAQEATLMDDGRLIYAPPDQVARTLAQIASLGVDRVKVSVSWAVVAPDPGSARHPNFDATDPAAYPRGAWDRYDTVVRMAHELGLGVYFQFTPPAPKWALARGFPIGQGIPLGQAPSANQFREFVKAVGRRYSGTYVEPIAPGEPQPPPPPDSLLGGLGLARAGGQSNPQPSQSNLIPRVDYWGIWNEPNFPSWLNPAHRRLRSGQKELTQPALYRGLVDGAWSALQATGHAGDTFLIGETANFGNVAPVPFIEDLYCVGPSYRPLTGHLATGVGCPRSGRRASFLARHPGLFHATGYAHHPYSFDVAPNRPYPLQSWITLPNLGWLERVLNGIFAGYGRGRANGIPLYLSEWGYKTNPPNPYVQTSLAEQATWLNEGEYITWRDPYVAALNQFLLVDDAPRANEPVGSPLYWHTFQTGLQYLDGTRKPSYFAYRIPIWLPSARHGRRVTVWGQLRPADHRTVQDAVLQFRRPGSGAWRDLRHLQTASSRGFLLAHVTIPASGAVRLTWLDPQTGQFDYSRTVSVS